jgi:hypothetical protein
MKKVLCLNTRRTPPTTARRIRATHLLQARVRMIFLTLFPSGSTYSQSHGYLEQLKIRQIKQGSACCTGCQANNFQTGRQGQPCSAAAS